MDLGNCSLIGYFTIMAFYISRKGSYFLTHGRLKGPHLMTKKCSLKVKTNSLTRLQSKVISLKSFWFPTPKGLNVV